jgi:type II secretory pathway pseudopilin PulG
MNPTGSVSGRPMAAANGRRPFLRRLPSLLYRASGIPCSKGITLIELLVVIALFAAIMALSAGAYIMSSRRYRQQGAAAQLEVTIRQARNDALFAGAPSFVEFDTRRPAPNPPRIIPWGYRISGMWHFEEAGGKEASGGRGNRAFVNNCASADGKIGRAVATGWIRNGQGVRGYVECLPNPDFDCEDGGYLEAYIFVEFEIQQPQYVFRKPDCYSLYVNANGFLCGQVGRTTVEAPNFVIPMRRWTKVAMAFDKNSIRLLVDDAIVAVEAGEETPTRINPLYIGDSSAPILGRIDEAKVFTAVRGNPFELPATAKLTHNTAPWNAAFFTSDGQLDLRYHPGPITVNMILDRRVHPIYINMLGLTRRGEVEREKTEDELAAEEAARVNAQKPRTIAPIRVPPVKIPVLPPKPPAPPPAEKPADKPAEAPPATPAEAPAGTAPEGGTK